MAMDGDALTLAAGELVRIEMKRKSRRREPHPVEQLRGAGRRFAARQPQMKPHALGDLCANGLDRIEGGQGFLRDQRQPPAAQAAKRRLVHRDQVATVQQDTSPSSGTGRQEAHHGARGHRLSAARFADQPDPFARREIEVHRLDRPKDPVGCRQLDA
jgi:hypothetical protein